MDTRLNKSFNVKFSSSNSFFTPKIVKKPKVFDEFTPEVTPYKPEPEDLEEIIYYDGGGVDGYGYE